MGLGLLILAGCSTPVRPDVDGMVCASASRPVDLLPGEPTSKGVSSLTVKQAPSLTPQTAPQLGKATDAVFDNLLLTSAQQPKNGEQLKKMTTLETRLQVPPGVPGATVAPIQLPNPTKDPEAFNKAVKKYFPPLPAIGTEQEPQPGPGGQPLTLTNLQQLARDNSPLLRQAGADVKAAEGAARQAGLYSNPTFGVQSATASNNGGPTYGVILGQTITTMGKKKLAEAAAIMELENAQLAFQRAETDLMAAVRSGYFAVLVAQESIKANRALVSLTDEVYKVNVDQSLVGEAAPYEPMQVAVFSGQARLALIQARESYTLAWKQLVAKIGIRGMPPTELAGRIDMPLPKYDYGKVLDYVLTHHTEVLTATVSQNKARYNLRLAEVTAIPDVTVQATLTNDASLGVNNRLFAGVQATVPVPVWDRNQGAIQQARGALLRAVEESHRVRDDLTQRVADAFSRYDANQKILEIYRADILPKQVQAFRAAVTRHYGGEPGKVAFTDLITSEQNLVSVIAPYLAALGAQWQAVVDVANLLQTEDLFQADGVFPVAPIPDLEHLLQLPCCHPCSPLPNSTAPNVDQSWPPAGFGAAGDNETRRQGNRVTSTTYAASLTSELGVPLVPSLGTPRAAEVDVTSHYKETQR
jgi:cobalt-zinc-cadmium efflux system outer membrane protein